MFVNYTNQNIAYDWCNILNGNNLKSLYYYVFKDKILLHGERDRVAFVFSLDDTMLRIRFQQISKT